jgi:uncharacterized protein (TIGR02996 family)
VARPRATSSKKKGALSDALANVYAHPDSDEHRLVYADWLAEHGDPARAELIVLQCLPTPPTEAQRRRERDLLVENATRWAGPTIVG